MWEVSENWQVPRTDLYQLSLFKWCESIQDKPRISSPAQAICAHASTIPGKDTVVEWFWQTFWTVQDQSLKKSFHPSEPTADNTGNPHWNISQISKVVIPILQSSYPKFWKKNRPSQKGFGKILGIPIFPRKTHRVTTAPDSFLPVRCAGLHRQKHRLPSSSSPPWGSLWIPQAVGGLMVCWWWFLHGQFIKEA